VRACSFELEDLRELKELYLHDNRLTEVPEGLGFLGKLTKLTLDQNRLTTVPPALERLVAGGSHLDVAPSWLGQVLSFWDIIAVVRVKESLA
jgi:Leucine-rich repeat (LRR) protein